MENCTRHFDAPEGRSLKNVFTGTLVVQSGEEWNELHLCLHVHSGRQVIAILKHNTTCFQLCTMLLYTIIYMQWVPPCRTVDTNIDMYHCRSLFTMH